MKQAQSYDPTITLQLAALQSEAWRGDPDAQLALGLCYRKGEGLSRDYAEAMKWFGMSAEQGHADAQFELAVLYEFGQDVRQDYEMAFKWYLAAAEQGHAGAQNNLAVLYGLGLGVKQDFKKTYFWYWNATNGNVTAQSKQKYKLSRIYDAQTALDEAKAIRNGIMDELDGMDD